MKNSTLWVIKNKTSNSYPMDKIWICIIFIYLPNIDRLSKFFHCYTQQEICRKSAIKHSPQISPHLKHVATLPREILMFETKFPRTLWHYLAETWTRQRRDVLQTSIAMTEASHSNRLNRPWLPQRQISNRHCTISTRRRNDWLSILVRRRFAPTSSFFVAAVISITEPNEDNINQQLFSIAELHMTVCFYQFVSRCLFKHFKPRSGRTNMICRLRQ